MKISYELFGRLREYSKYKKKQFARPDVLGTCHEELGFLNLALLSVGRLWKSAYVRNCIIGRSFPIYAYDWDT